MRSNLDNNKAQDLQIRSAEIGTVELTLSGDIEIAGNGPLSYFLDPNGANRDVTLPSTGTGGKIFFIANVGSADNLVVKNQAGTTLLTILSSEGAIFACSPTQWAFFSYGKATGGAESTTMSSDDDSISITKVGDNFDIVVNEANVDHDSLSGFVADEHVAHSGVTLTAGTGLSGGGDISANRTFNLDLDSLTSDTPVLTDTFPFHDVGDGPNKATLATLNALLVHDDLVGFVANEHVDHSTVSVSAGAGLSGGGTIDTTRTISLDINGQTNAALVSADEFIYWDVDGTDFNKRTFSEMLSDLNVLTTADEGSGNGLDADTVDGVEAAAFLQGANNLSDVGDAATAYGNIKQAGSKTATGALELAVASEINSRDSSRAMPADEFADSDFGEEVQEIELSALDASISTGDGKAGFIVPPHLDGWDMLAPFIGSFDLNSASGGSIDIQIHNLDNDDGAVDMLSTKLTQAFNETFAEDGVVDTSAGTLQPVRRVVKGDRLRIDIDAVTTGEVHLGTVLGLRFRKVS